MKRSPSLALSLFVASFLILPAVGAAATAAADPGAVVDAYFDAYRAMDVERMLGSYAPDALFVDVAQRHRLEGTDGLRQLLVPLVSVHSAMGIDVRRRVVSGNLVVVDYVYEGTLSGEALRAATGKETCRDTPYRLPVTSWFEVRDGRISRQTDYIDLATFQEIRAQASGAVEGADTDASPGAEGH